MCVCVCVCVVYGEYGEGYMGALGGYMDVLVSVRVCVRVCGICKVLVWEYRVCTREHG